MTELETRFDTAIKDMHISSLELNGMRTQPLLAIKIGLAAGYKMGMEDTVAQVEKIKQATR